MITTPSGLQYEDTVVGNGEIAQAGGPVQVHYTGWLFNNGTQGAKVDSSKDRGQPVSPGAQARCRQRQVGQTRRGTPGTQEHHRGEDRQPAPHHFCPIAASPSSM